MINVAAMRHDREGRDTRVANSARLRAFAFLTARGQGGSLPH